MRRVNDPTKLNMATRADLARHYISHAANSIYELMDCDRNDILDERLEQIWILLKRETRKLENNYGKSEKDSYQEA